MPDSSQLPFLLKLLDDDSELVQAAVVKALAEFGDALPAAIAALPKEQQVASSALAPVYRQLRRRQLESSWAGWSDIEGDKPRLEMALSLLADYQDEGDGPRATLSARLDALAEEAREALPEPDPRSLAVFLFGNDRLKGAVANYYHPRNSSLVRVLDRGQGLPIALCCIYILVGYRLGLEIEGCNFPGHFLAQFRDGKERVLVDCFNGGKLVDETVLVKSDSKLFVSPVDPSRLETDAEIIVLRVLNNLARAYHLAKSPEDATLMLELARSMRKKKSKTG